MVIFTEDAGFAEVEHVHLILNTLTGIFLKKKMIKARLSQSCVCLFVISFFAKHLEEKEEEKDSFKF